MHTPLAAIVELRMYNASFHSYNSCCRKGPTQNAAPLESTQLSLLLNRHGNVACRHPGILTTARQRPATYKRSKNYKPQMLKNSGFFTERFTGAENRKKLSQIHFRLEHSLIFHFLILILKEIFQFCISKTHQKCCAGLDQYLTARNQTTKENTQVKQLKNNLSTWS